MPMCFVKKTRILWHISKWFLSLSPCGKHEGIFPPDIHYDNLVGFLEVKFTKAWESLMISSPLVSPTYPKWASNNSSIIVQAFLPQDWVFWRFLLWQVTESPYSTCFPPQFGGQWFSLWDSQSWEWRAQGQAGGRLEKTTTDVSQISWF